MNKHRDVEILAEYLEPFLLKKGLPTDIEFIKDLSDAFVDATKKLVKFRADRADRAYKNIEESKESKESKEIKELLIKDVYE